MKELDKKIKEANYIPGINYMSVKNNEVIFLKEKNYDIEKIF